MGDYPHIPESFHEGFQFGGEDLPGYRLGRDKHPFGVSRERRRVPRVKMRADFSFPFIIQLQDEVMVWFIANNLV
jgi:hypothetical protein